MALGSTNRKVLCIVGDGACMFGLQGLWTAAKYRIPVIFVVLRNRAYMVDRTLKALDRKVYIGTDLGTPDIQFAALARAMGIESTQVANPDEISPALKSAWHSEQPYLLEFLVEEANPRRILPDTLWAPWLSPHASAEYPTPFGR